VVLNFSDGYLRQLYIHIDTNPDRHSHANCFTNSYSNAYSFGYAYAVSIT
jgi:hypothetical protein